MKKQTGLLMIMGVGVVVLLVTAVTLAQGNSQFAIPWWTVDGGGGESGGSGQKFHISGTIGQPDAGPVMQSSSYTFTGGFWRGLAAAGPGSGSIYLPIIVKPAPPPPCFGSGQEREPNNSYGEADANGLLCDGVTITGTFDDQNDYFAMQSGANGLIDVSLTGYSGNDAQILLYYQRNLVAQGIHPAYRIQYTGPAGQYHIRVFIPIANNQDYSLHVNFP